MGTTTTQTIVKTAFTPGWDAGARSIASFAQDGGATWQVGQAIGIVCGLNSLDEGADYREIDHAFFMESGHYRIIENGVIKTSTAKYSSDAVFKIERIQGLVYYSIDETLVYTSLHESEGPVFVDCSLYYYLDTIIGLDVYDLPFAYLSGRFKPLTGLMVEAGLELLRGFFEPLTGSLVMADSATWRGEFQPLVGTLVEDGVSALRGEFAPLVGTLEEVVLVPDYTALVGRFEPLYGVLLEDYETDSNDLQGEFAPLVGLLLEENVSVLRGSFAPLTGRLWTALSNQMLLVWPRWRFTLRERAEGSLWGIAQCDLPALVGSAGGGLVEGATARCWLPALTGAAFGGATVRCDLPALTGEAQATSPGFATALCDLPALEGEASGITGSLARALCALPALEGEAFSGATVRCDLPALVGEATGLAGSVASALCDLPALVGNATGFSWGVASALCDLPALEGWAGSGVHVLCDLPALTGSATATHAVVTTDAETYAVNLSTGAVTRLLLGPLDKLVTAYGRLYALRDGELLTLDGAHDGLDGEAEPIPIPATIRFAQQNFGILNAKRCHAVYLDAREDDGLVLDLVADERTVWRYQTPTDTAPAMGTHKVKVGRGVKFHTLGLTVRNRNGGRLDVGGLEFLVQPLSPRPKT